MSFSTIHSALRYLDARCDGAHDQDGQGFNGLDSSFGKSLAAQDSLSPKQAAAAAKMLAKYARQLEGGGIAVEAIKAEAEGIASPSREISLNGSSFKVTLAYKDAAEREALKARTKARWDAASKTWRVAFDQAEALAQWAATYGFGIAPEAQARIDSPVIEAEPETEVEATITFDTEAAVYVIAWPYGGRMDDMRAQVKRCEGYRFDGIKKVWTVPADAITAGAMQTFVETFRCEISEGAANVLRGRLRAHEEIAQVIEASSALDAEIEVEGLNGELMPFQRAGVAALEMNDWTGMIADEQGLGKTVQALAAVQASQSFPALIVCESSLKINWKRHAEEWLPGRSVTVLAGTTPDPKAIEGYDIVIVNYDLLDAWEGVLGGKE